MKYVGVDVSKPDHCLGAIDVAGAVVQEPKRFTQDASGFSWLKGVLEELGGPSEVVIGMEATGHYWVLLAEELQSWGYQPQVFNPILSCDAGQTTVRGRTTDADDCLVIATVLRDGGFSAVQLPTPEPVLPDSAGAAGGISQRPTAGWRHGEGSGPQDPEGQSRPSGVGAAVGGDPDRPGLDRRQTRGSRHRDGHPPHHHRNGPGHLRRPALPAALRPRRLPRPTFRCGMNQHPLGRVETSEHGPLQALSLIHI